MEELPVELIVENLKKMSVKELNNMCMTSKYIRGICKTYEDDIYNALIMRDFGIHKMKQKDTYRLYSLIKETLSEDVFNTEFITNQFDFFRLRVVEKKPELLEYYYKLGFDFTKLYKNNQTLIQYVITRWNLGGGFVSTINQKLKYLIPYYKDFNHFSIIRNGQKSGLLLELMFEREDISIDHFKAVMDKTDKKYYQSLFASALRFSTIDIIDLFLEKGIQYTSNYLESVLRNPNISVIERFAGPVIKSLEKYDEVLFQLVERVSNIALTGYVLDLFPQKINITNENGETLLFDRFLKFDTDAIILLIQRGADVNIQNENGDTVVHLYKLTNSIRELVEQIDEDSSYVSSYIINNADMTLKNVDGLTPEDDINDPRNQIMDRYDIAN